MTRTAKTKRRTAAPPAAVKEIRVQCLVLVDANGRERGRLQVLKDGPRLKMSNPAGFEVELNCGTENAGLVIDHRERKDTLVAGLTAAAEPDHLMFGRGELFLCDDGKDADEGGGIKRSVHPEHLTHLRSLTEWLAMRSAPEEVQDVANLLATARRGMTDRQWAALSSLISEGFKAAALADGPPGKAVAS